MNINIIYIKYFFVLFFVKVTFLIFSLSKFMFFSVHFYLLKKKSNFLNNNYGIRAVIVCFYCMLIDMINWCIYLY